MRSTAAERYRQPLITTKWQIHALTIFFVFLAAARALGETPSLEQVLERAEPAQIASEARRRGDPARGALVYFKSAAGCVQCYQRSGDQKSGQHSPLGPDLAQLGDGITDIHLVEALLDRSKSIRMLTIDGNVQSGIGIAHDAMASVVTVTRRSSNRQDWEHTEGGTTIRQWLTLSERPSPE